MSESTKSGITVAIIGGGIGGICAAIALGRSGYDVHIFEQASKFSEIGAGVGFGANALHALHLLGLGDDYEQIADVSPAGDPWFSFLSGKDCEPISEVLNPAPRGSVHRARFLECLLARLPPTVSTHFSSRVISVENISSRDDQAPHVRLTTVHPDSSNSIQFKADIALGCDGVKSMVRDSFQQEMGACVRYTGTYAYRGLMNLEKAASEAGDFHIVMFPIEHGKILNIVAFVSDRTRPPEERVWEGPWVKPVTRQEMFDDYAEWDPRVHAILSLVDKPEKWALHDLLPLERWTVGRVTLLGDSAHASLPHNGAGAGQAIEDVYVLSKLLGHPSCAADNIPAFLQAYEHVRRPRASRQQIHSRESGDIYEFASPMGDDYAKIDEHLQRRYDWLWNHDLDSDVEEALTFLRDRGVLAK
ncbi:FAD/NAD(P)-binding domain-containing protein [Punctularia strigosozonata HHB-11173 SS5]|uniref:FAD/NAD(P)-binding domain-containing protein n=1 Tax=Punctularia strigosozonata (strain HHB-11173) TaxID=741275 RepID=R7S2C0_PUNST|nr:FAD/NAD(P)-binding domain-containing protein [Punctularia strigosozonata HHB-11173 SS5]EIN03927.1 FAD/NAD(P)-binding domain-containing protein [Punctularia strigosozonata HHB-11173 SS5]